ncbi:MAG: nitronate monooxygenase [Chloroflexi bacterium]|nr:nitronate monooxygenase [Chloroflexota bacterium]
MNWLTTPKLVAAVSNAGGLGVLATQHYDKDRLKKALGDIRALTDRPFGANITLGVGNEGLLIPVVLEDKVPVVNYSLGRPPEITALAQAVHAYGGKMIGTVAMLKHALRSEQLGIDMLNITGYEAAAHAGSIGALVLVPTITSAVKIPCIGAGGYCDGKGLAAALALGAEGIAMGTRLAATRDAEVNETVKKTWLKATEEDTVIDTAFDGINCRVLRNKGAEDMMKKRLPVADSISAALFLKHELRLTWPQLLRTANAARRQPAGVGIGSQRKGLARMMRIATSSRLFAKATVEGDVENGLLMLGQGAGRIHDIPTVAELLERTVREAEQIVQRLNRGMAP